MKRFLGLLLAAVMVLAMNLTAFAADDNTFTIKAPDNGHTYEVYQIFTGDYYEGVLSNIKWGQNGTGTTGEVVSSEKLEKLTDLTDSEKPSVSDVEELKVISEFVNLDEDPFMTVKGGNSIEVPAGYYLIKDVNGSQNGEYDSYTLYIVEVADDITIAPKASVPTVEKKVQEDDKYSADNKYGDGYNDVADWNIGDKVPFKLIGTLPSKYEDYTSYKYIFHDTMSEGLEFDPESVEVYYASKEDGTGKTMIDEKDYTVVVGKITDACSFEVVFNNLKDITGLTSESKIIVEYKAELTDKAVIGLPGNPNEVYLEFSNNPNIGGEGDTGKTPTDKVIVFTYELDVTKVEEGSSTVVPNAEFKLRDEDGKYVVVDAEGKVTGWSDTEEHGSILKSDDNGLFKVIGLDDGTYYLKETKAPDGYNILQDEIKLVISATTENGQEWSGKAGEALKAITISVDDAKPNTGDIENGTVEIIVENSKGSILPETGGMGTTIFYALGAILVLGAGVLLIARRRADAEE